MKLLSPKVRKNHKPLPEYDVINHAQRYANNLVESAFQTIEGVPIKDKPLFCELAQFMAQRKA